MSYETGYVYTHTFRFTQAEVAQFAAVTGDNNPVHLDEAYAATTMF
ncbi:MAG: MaoC/PaaZ C-terminal domain-containing protein, partial [Bacteroidia bacterium]